MTLLETPAVAAAPEEPPMTQAVVAEDLTVPERIVCAPAAGVFRPAPPTNVTAEGEIVYAGQVVGSIEGTDAPAEVVSPFTGFFMGMLAHAGERVRAAQPILWVRVTGS